MRSKLISVIVRDNNRVILSKVVEDEDEHNDITFTSWKSILEWLEIFLDIDHSVDLSPIKMCRVLNYAEVSWDDGEYPYQIFMNWS